MLINFLLSFALMLVYLINHSSPQIVFTLQWQPLNVVTSALIDPNLKTLTFVELESYLELPSLLPGTYHVSLEVSGFLIVNGPANDELTTFRIEFTQGTIAFFQMQTLGQYQYGFRLSAPSSGTLYFQNFAKIESENFAYGVILSNLTIEKIIV